MGILFKSDDEKKQEKRNQTEQKAGPFIESGNYIEAAKVYLNHIRTHDYYDPWGWNQAAWFFYCGGQVTYDTLQMADMAVGLSGLKHWNYLDTRAVILWELGLTMEAFRDWKNAVDYMQGKKDQEVLENIYNRINSIFISYPFSQKDTIPSVSKANDLLGCKFNIVTAKTVENTPLRDKIYTKIRSSYYFVSFLYKKMEFADGSFSVSPFILDEISYALSRGREYFLLIEEGVNCTELPTYWLHGKHEYVPFNTNTCFEAVADVLNALKDSRNRLFKEVTGLTL